MAKRIPVVNQMVCWVVCAALATVLILGAGATQAAPTSIYWDINSTTAGAGGTTPSGNWDGATANWNTDSTGGAGGALSATTSSGTSGTIAVFSAGTDATGDYTVTVSGTQNASGLLVEDGNVTLSGGTIVVDQGDNGTTIGASNGHNLIINSTLNAPHATYAFALKASTGNLTLNAANNITGYISMGLNANGRLNLGNAGALGTGSLRIDNNGTRTIDNTSGNAMTLASNGILFNASGVHTLKFIGTNDLTFGGAVSSGNSAKTVQVDAGKLTFNAGLTGGGAAASLTKTGAGTLIINGNSSTYTGAINVNAGTLGGTTSLSGTVTVAAGATLAPGSSPGTLGTGTLILNDTSVLDFDLDALAGPNDKIAVTGNLTLDGILNVTNLGGLQAGQYTLLTYTGTLTDNGLSLGTMPGGFTYGIDTGTSGSVILNVIPEPATVALLVLGGVGALLRRRR